jgi:adenine deaminase
MIPISPRRTLATTAIFALTLTTALSAQDRTILIPNGRVLDGTGNPWFQADVLIRGDRIEAVGDLEGMDADEGMVHVFVNGEAAIRGGALTGPRPGRVLQKRTRPAS